VIFFVAGFWLALLSGLAGCHPLPVPGTTGLRDVSLQLRTLQMKNGLRVIVEEDHSSPIVGVVSLIGVGASSDPRGKEGLAHFVEHLTFRSKPDSKSKMSSLLVRGGAGAYNAVTSLDTTMYFEFGAPETLRSLLALEGARLVNPVFNVDAATFEVEREVVRNELRLRNETGYHSQLLTWAQSAVFSPNHPYSRPLIGTHESLSAIRIEDAQEFAQRQYRPDNIIIAIVGDVNVAQVPEMLSRTLPPQLWQEGKHIGPPPSAGADVEMVDPPAHELYRFSAAVPTPELLIAWSLPRAQDSQDLVLQSIVSVVNSALQQVDDEDVSLAVASILPARQASLLMCQVFLKQGTHPEASAQSVLDRVRLQWMTSVSDIAIAVRTITFAQLRLTARTRMSYDLEDIQRRAVLLAQVAYFAGVANAYTRPLKALEQLDSRQVARFIDRYLSPKRAKTAFVLPSTGGPVASEGEHDVLVEAPDDRVKVLYPSDAIRSIIHPVSAKHFQTLRLGNGLEVIIAHRPTWPLITLELALRGGTATAEPRGVAELSRLATRRLLGVHGYPFQYGIQIQEQMTEDATLLAVEAGSGNLDTALAMLSDRVQQFEIEERSLSVFRTRALPLLEARERTPNAQADRAFWDAVFWPARFRRPAMANELARVKAVDVQRWLEQTYSPKNSILAVVGDVDAVEAQKSIERWLSDWKENRPTENKASVVTASATNEGQHQTVVVTHRPAASQGEIRLGCSTRAEDPKSALSYEILAELIAQKLVDAARERFGATYGFHGSARSFQSGISQIVVSGAVDNDNLKRVIDLIRQHWPKVADDDLSEESIDRIRWKLARRYNLQYATGPALAHAIVQTRIQGFSPELLERFSDLLLSVTRADLRTAASSCRESAVISIFGDEKTINAALNGAWN
jgi:zinc protease